MALNVHYGPCTPPIQPKFHSNLQEKWVKWPVLTRSWNNTLRTRRKRPAGGDFEFFGPGKPKLVFSGGTDCVQTGQNSGSLAKNCLDKNAPIPVFWDLASKAIIRGPVKTGMAAWNSQLRWMLMDDEDTLVRYICITLKFKKVVLFGIWFEFNFEPNLGGTLESGHRTSPSVEHMAETIKARKHADKGPEKECSAPFRTGVPRRFIL
ncbi:hypothetical protein C8F04DRAFT_1294381 [Mycena alexandri]|uniref:Uncharacterized protein n=1 Tax=Mycena alexandri TaxID=1745969 RepID=A0AAD6X017_9AGAR|nr:hypothetical protein C8F04DRAFT_1294381 [Mycena alexandri]